MYKIAGLALTAAICFLSGMLVFDIWSDSQVAESDQAIVSAHAEEGDSTSASGQVGGKPPGDLPLLSPTLEDIENAGSEFERQLLSYRLASQASKVELQDLFIQTASLPRPSDRRAIGEIFLRRLFEYDPELALKFSLDRQPLETMVTVPYLTEIFYGWARTDLQAAIAAIHTITDEQLQYAAIDIVVKSLDDLTQDQVFGLVKEFDAPILTRHYEVRAEEKEWDLDPKQSWEKAVALEDEGMRHQRLQNIANAWIREDPRAVLRAAASLKNVNTQNTVVGRALFRWMGEDRDAVIDWLQSDQSIPNKKSYLSHLFWSMARDEPHEAFNIASGLANDTYRQEALQGILGGWSQVDSEAAMAWVRNASADIEITESTYLFMLGEYAKTDPAAALEVLFELPIRDPTQAGEHIAEAVNLRDMGRYAERLSKSGGSQVGDKTLQGYVTGWANKNAANAANWLVEQNLGESQSIQQTYDFAFSALARSDVQEAVDLVMSLEPSINRDYAISSVMYHIKDNRALQAKLYRMVADPQKRAEIRYYLNSAQR